MFSRINDFVIVADPEGDIVFEGSDLLKFTGPRGLIASGVVIRLFERAFRDLSPASPPVRSEIKVLSAFPGANVVDGIEMITRAVHSGRFILDMEKAPKDAPPSPAGGFLYFEVAYRDKAFGYTFSPDLFSKEWYEQVKIREAGCPTVEEHSLYVQMKFELLGKLLTVHNPFLRVEPCALDSRFASAK